jgi:hypothetical protein
MWNLHQKYEICWVMWLLNTSGLPPAFTLVYCLAHTLPWRWRRHDPSKRPLVINGTTLRYTPEDRTILIQFLRASLRRPQCPVCRASICMLNDASERSGLDLFQAKTRFLWVSLSRSQCPVCRASICNLNDALEGSGLDLFQVKSRFLWTSLRRSVSSVQSVNM